MATYSGEVIASEQDDFPFMAVIIDNTGNVIGEFPVRTQADGAAKIVEVLRGLEEEAKKGGHIA